MKGLIYIAGMLAFCACNSSNNSNQVLQQRIDSLEQKLSTTYKPGFGECMSSIQVHHNKLWFAGTAENWRLADFEIHEIKEALDAIGTYQTGRKESKEIGMINPPLDSVIAAIEQKNPAAFKSSYMALTTTCNKCHQATDFGFNVVKVPDTPPFSNQSFR